MSNTTFTTWLITLTKLRGEILSDDEIEVAAYRRCRRRGSGRRDMFWRYRPVWHVAGFNALKTAGLRGVLFQETDFSAENRTAEVRF